MKHILSIQGGGIRGIVPCCALASLEKYTGKLARETFSFVGGTSTGALLAGCIAAGVPAERALDVYLNRGRTIFSPTSSTARLVNLVNDGYQFSRNTLNRVVLDTLGAAAGWTMNDSPIPILITVADQAGNPWYATKDGPRNARTTGRWLLADAMTASACATTYHLPWPVKDKNYDGIGFFSDGGTVSLADPVYQVCVEAFLGWQCYGEIDPTEANVISLGTGVYRPENPQPPVGLLDNIRWVTSSLVGSSKTLAVQAVRRQWPQVPLSVFNPEIFSDIDEADVDQIDTLLAIGRQQAEAIDWAKILG